MTGNTKVWRAPLAGLASVAMIATMGVAASTANAASTTVQPSDDFSSAKSVADRASYTVRVYDAATPYGAPKTGGDLPTELSYKYGETLTTDTFNSLKNGQILDYVSYDQAGKEKVSVPYVVTGDVELYAHYKDAVTVTFDTNDNGKADGADASVKIAKGTALTADEYLQALGTDEEDAVTNPDTSKYNAFAGWTTEYTKDHGTSSALYEGGALNEDTVLYQRWGFGADLAEVSFRTAGTASYDFGSFYTLNGKAFPAFRAPYDTMWKTSLEGAAYDFSTPVRNVYTTKPDLELVASVDGPVRDVTVKFDYTGAHTTLDNPSYEPNKDAVATTAASKVSEPVAPVKAGAVFTGWYTTNPLNADGSFNPDAKKYDFSKSVAGNFANPTNTVTVYAGWDYVNVSAFVFNVNYRGWADSQQVWFVTPNKSYDLPKLWDYYQTAAQNNAAKGEFTSRSVENWTWGKDKVTKAAASANKSVDIFDANWDSSLSIKLHGNGGLFGANDVKWVTKTDTQKWADVVTEPTRAGYTFIGWTDKADSSSAVWANTNDGYFYNYSDLTAKVSPNKQLKSGQDLYAQWKQSSKIDIQGLRDRFFTKHTAADRTAAIKTVANYGYTEDSAAKYVDAVNALEAEFATWKNTSNADKKAELADALAPKYAAAEALLVKVSVDPSDPSNPFTDVLKGHTPHYSDIIAGYHAGLIQGWQEANGTVTFRPRTEVLRQDYAAFLYRLAGSPEFDVTKATKTFADVDSSTPHYKEILWAASNGVIGGFADGTFRGTDTIQRQDAMEMLYRLAGSPKVEDADKAFTDSSATPFAEAIAWAKAEGVSTGYEDGSFGVGRNIIRQDLAAFLNRAAAVLKK